MLVKLRNLYERKRKRDPKFPNKDYFILMSPSDIEDYHNEIKGIMFKEYESKQNNSHYLGISLLVLNEEFLYTPIILKNDFMNWNRIK